MGALIVTLIKMLRILTDSADNGNGNSGGAAFVVQCCLSCIADIINYLDDLAMAFMAISGDKFCTSAWNGLLLNLKHLVKFYIALDIGNFFVFMGQMSISFASTGIFYALC